MRSWTFFFYVRYNLFLIFCSLIIQKWQIMNFICNIFRQCRKGSKWQLKFLCSSPQTHKSKGRNSGSQKPHIVKGHLKVITYIPRQAVQTGFWCFYESALQCIIKNLHWDSRWYLRVAGYACFQSQLIKKDKARCLNLIMVIFFYIS